MAWWNAPPPVNNYYVPPQPRYYNPGYVAPNYNNNYNPFTGQPVQRPQVYVNPGYNPYGTTTVPLNPNLYNNTYQLQPPQPQPQPYVPPYKPQWYGSPVTGFNAPGSYGSPFSGN